MKAHPYMIKGKPKAKGLRLERVDPRVKKFDEKWLQDLIIEHPDILPTGEIEAIFEPLVFLGKEISVSTGRIDILFMSPHGYPVIVETKLWRNPESKRQVVAQVLDFAFALSKWDYDQLDNQIKKLSRYGGQPGKSIRVLMKRALERQTIEFDEFRESVEKNLPLGRFLVAVVGDKIRSSSRDIFESLNRYPGLGLELSMIELECFTVDPKKDSSLLIVPRIAKETEIIERSIVEVVIKEDIKPQVTITQQKAIDDTGKKKKILLTEAEFWDRLMKSAPQNYDLVKKIVDEYREKPLIEVVPGRNGMKFIKILSEFDNRVGLFFIVTDSSINVRPQGMRLNFESVGLSPSIIEEFGERIKAVLNGKFRAPIDKVNLRKFNKTIADFIDEIDKHDIAQ